MPQQQTYRFYASTECAATALAKRLGYGRATSIHTTQREDSTMAKKSGEKAAKRAAAPADDYTKQKLAVQGQCRIGSTMTYSGPNKVFGGQKVKVVGHESRGGILVELGDRKLTCSPFALLGRPDKPSKSTKAKAARKRGKAKADRTSKAPRKASQKPAPVPTPAPQPAADPAPKASVKATSKPVKKAA